MSVKIGNNKNAFPMENLAVLFHHVSSQYYCIWHFVCRRLFFLYIIKGLITYLMTTVNLYRSKLTAVDLDSSYLQGMQSTNGTIG